MASNDLINNILDSKLDINCVSITLTQCGTENPIVFKSPGRIQQDSNGQLSLHMIYVSVEAIPFSYFSLGFREVSPGIIIPDDYFFDMVAVDTFQSVWKAQKLNLITDCSCPTNSIVIKSHFDRLTLESEKTQTEYPGWLQFIIPYSVELPCNEIESYGNEGKRRTIFSATISDVCIKINNAEAKLVISATAQKELDLKLLAQAIISGLSVIVGMQLKPAVKQTRVANIYTIEVRSLEKMSRSQLQRPFNSTAPFHYPNTVNFLDSYVTTFLQEPIKMTELYGYWHKVFMAYDTSRELWALALTTSIEGIFKNHFSNMLKHDDSFEEKLNDACTKITKAGIDQLVHRKLEGSLSGFKKKSIKAGLEEYVTTNPSFSKWPSDWNDLRNKATHADILDESRDKVQKYWNQTFTCLAIFYHLVADVIQYDGELTAYSVMDWPELPKDQKN